MMDVLKKIQEIAADQLDVDESLITMDASFINDLEADSLDLVQLMMAFEEEFDMEISDEEAEEISTVGDAVNYIKEHQK
ncbi:MAG: acyl carrier protein [Clostridia bacterium]|nr:acyl carrier protein [Clostridia bacterium]